MNRKKAEEYARYIASHRVDVDRFAGVSDVVEILRLIHQPPPPDPLVKLVPYAKSAADLYRGLSQDEADRLVALVAENADLLRQVATHLACYTPHDLERCQQALLATGDAYPTHAFRAARVPVVERLLALVDSSVRGDAKGGLDHALGALAWSRHPRAIERMQEWEARPPKWREMLFWAPHEFATEAGYAIEGGAVRNLVPSTSLRLVPTGEAPTSSGSTVSLFEPGAGGPPCPRCSRAPVNLLSVESSALPDELRGAVPPRVPTCLECACFGTIFVQFARDGSWRWLQADAKPEGTTGGWALEPRRATLVPRSPWEAIDWCVAEGLSQLGGHPSWVQDPEYPRCPSCARRMATVAQVGLEDFFDAMEGVFFVHHCEACAVVGVSYQQS